MSAGEVVRVRVDDIDALERKVDATIEVVKSMRAENAALAAALEDIAGMRRSNLSPEVWIADAECSGLSNAWCYGHHPDDPDEWCPVCVAEVAWCAWKMGVLGG